MSSKDSVRINRAIEDGSFFENPALAGAAERVRDTGAACTCSGSSPYGGVHSHMHHLQALLELARRHGLADRTWIHAFTDGRDVSPHAAVRDLPTCPPKRSRPSRWRPLLRDGPRRPLGAHRPRLRGDHRGRGEVAEDAIDAVQSYDRGVTDEFVEPVVLIDRPLTSDDEAIFFNFQPDRAGSCPSSSSSAASG